MANWRIWQTGIWRTGSCGEPTMANWHMGKRRHISSLHNKKNLTAICINVEIYYHEIKKHFLYFISPDKIEFGRNSFSI